jgi:integrase
MRGADLDTTVTIHFPALPPEKGDSSMTTKRSRHRNAGLRKRCSCSRKVWPKCPHPWHFNFKPKGGPHYQLSLDAELGRPINSKSEAQELADRIRAEIRAGTFRRMRDEAPAAPPVTASDVVSLDRFASIFMERVSKAGGKVSWNDDESLLKRVREHVTTDGRRLGDFPLSAITEDELEAFYTSLLAAGRAASTRNHYVHLLKAAFRWATKKGYIGRSPISDDSTLTRSKHAQRARRITPDEEDALLKAAQAVRRGLAVGLYGLIVAAIETGCRQGELLGWQWGDVDLDRREVRVRGENTKDEETRFLPISTRLAAVLEMAKADPAGCEYPSTAYVFGVLGQQVKNISKAWETCVLRAHGHEPNWVKGGKLSKESRANLRAIDLHFHDLRHEAGSRWLEAAWPIHHVKEMLGHANISQTDTYLNAGRIGLHESMRRFEHRGIRWTSVGQKPAIEHRPTYNGEGDESSKGLLH